MLNIFDYCYLICGLLNYFISNILDWIKQYLIGSILFCVGKVRKQRLVGLTLYY